VKELVADLLTPVSAFLKVAEHSDYAFLLESVEGGEHVGRYSFLGKDPFLILRGRNGQTVMEKAGVTTDGDKPFIDTLRELMNSFQSPFVPGLPRFTGGAVGYLGYDTAAWFEPTAARGGPPADQDEAGFMVFDTVLAFDHVQHRILLIANARISGDEDLKSLYQFACAKIEFLESELERSLSLKRPSGGDAVKLVSNVSQDAYEAIVKRAKEYIAAGDIYQVVLSQRFEAEVGVDAFTVFRALRHVNPSPYMFFIRMGDRSIVGSSPEMLVRVEGRHAVTHPIAGTRPRGKSEEEDRRLADELKRNEKEKAEHVMLVDLGRNDIGRVCDYGTVRVPTFMGLERYSHVMHLVSVVEGDLAEGRDRLDALVSCFPAGTVSGAPKVRAMQIINELEPTRRGLYAGAVGYLDFAGNLDFCIAIRSILLEGGKAYIQAGAGIVADSNPTAEYEETRDKARAMIRALELAQSGL
jgi:anthranilate synthase component 1